MESGINVYQKNQSLKNICEHFCKPMFTIFEKCFVFYACRLLKGQSVLKV